MPNPPAPQALPGNRLLAQLPEVERQRLSSRLHPVPLTPHQVLHKARSVIEHVYFPNSGVISAMTIMQDGSAIEVATIGNEGVAGLLVFTGVETSPNETSVQVAGDALRMSADAFRDQCSRDTPLRRVVALYNVAFYAQVSYAVACNGLHTVEKRCCRWLLMAADRVGSNELPLTHEFLGIMLGVRRPSVTTVLQVLQGHGLIETSRGLVRITDRPGLQRASCECYQAIKDEFTRQFG